MVSITHALFITYACSLSLYLGRDARTHTNKQTHTHTHILFVRAHTQSHTHRYVYIYYIHIYYVYNIYTYVFILYPYLPLSLSGSLETPRHHLASCMCSCFMPFRANEGRQLLASQELIVICHMKTNENKKTCRHMSSPAHNKRLHSPALIRQPHLQPRHPPRHRRVHQLRRSACPAGLQ